MVKGSIRTVQDHTFRLLVTTDLSDAAATLIAPLTTAGFQLTYQPDRQRARDILAADPTIDLLLIVSDCCQRQGTAAIHELRTVTRAGIVVMARCPDSGACALERGADDWVHTTVTIRELCARLNNLAVKIRGLRRTEPQAKRIHSFAGWQLNIEHRLLTTPDGQTTPLTSAEALLLEALVTNPGQSLERSWLLERTSQRDLAPNSRNVDVTIAQLRRKLGDDPRQPRLILTMHGVGYRFAMESD